DVSPRIETQQPLFKTQTSGVRHRGGYHWRRGRIQKSRAFRCANRLKRSSTENRRKFQGKRSQKREIQPLAASKRSPRRQGHTVPFPLLPSTAVFVSCFPS